jgi:hypothetical protein
VKNTCLSVLLGRTPICQQLGCSMLACWHAGAGMLAFWSMATHRHRARDFETDPSLLIGVLLPVRWDMQTPQTFQHSWPLAIDRHASMPACHNRNAGMLGCTQASQTDQLSWPPPSLAGHRPALQEGAKNAGLSVLLPCTLACQRLGCWHAGILVDGQPAREGGIIPNNYINRSKLVWSKSH